MAQDDAHVPDDDVHALAQPRGEVEHRARNALVHVDLQHDAAGLSDDFLPVLAQVVLHGHEVWLLRNRSGRQLAALIQSGQPDAQAALGEDHVPQIDAQRAER